MPFIDGWINDRNTNRVYGVIRRNSHIDGLLTASGVDPDSVNCAYTPLIGASEFGKVSVLVMHQPSNNAPAPFVNVALDANATQWDIYLAEPGATPQRDANVLLGGATCPPPRINISMLDEPTFDPIGREVEGFREPLCGSSTLRSQPITSPTAPLDNAPQTLGANVPQPARSEPRTLRTSAAGGGGGTSGSGGTTSTGDTDTGAETDIGIEVSVTPLDADSPRWMWWANMIPISIRELRRSAAGTPLPNEMGRPRQNDSALFVIDFVDYRYALQSLFGHHIVSQVAGNGSSDSFMRDGSGGVVIGGTMRNSCFNMIAETPIALEAETCAGTAQYPRHCGVPYTNIFLCDEFNSGTIYDTNIGNLATSECALQTPYNFDQIVRQFQSSVAWMTSSRLKLSIDLWVQMLSQRSDDISTILNDGDLLNLDFRGMSLGQALDLFAQRLGAVWVWDRQDSCLRLELVEKRPTSITNAWLAGVEQHRISGYINSLTLDVPRTVYLMHESKYCSMIGPFNRALRPYFGDWGSSTFHRYGNGQPDEAAILFYVDSRSAVSEGGYVSTVQPMGLNTRAPVVWHGSTASLSHLTIDVRDHIPALVGTYRQGGDYITDLPGSPNDWQYGYGFQSIGDYSGAPAKPTGYQTYQPWNYDRPTFPMLFRDYTADMNMDSSAGYGRVRKFGMGTQGGSEASVDTSQSGDSFARGVKLAVTLRGRRAITEERIARLRGVLDGDMTLNRMPPVRLTNTDTRYKRQPVTPSMGLQYEQVQFGFEDSSTVRYRIYGKNTHPLLYPHGARINTAAGNANVFAANTGGINTITVRNAQANNIKRAFLCRFQKERAIGDLNVPADADEVNTPMIWLYRFTEVTPDGNPASLIFHSQNALGLSRAEGYALNICELHIRSEGGSGFVPEVAWDGSSLNFKSQSGGTNLDRTVPTPPAGYCICYEIYLRSGFTGYYLFAPNGMEVVCASPNTTSVAPAPWPYMGVSGVMTTDERGIASDIMDA